MKRPITVLGFVLFLSTLPASADTEPTPVYTVDPQVYAAVSAPVQNLPQKGIMLYGRRSVSYAFEFDRTAEYFLKISTAQVSSKLIPSEDYKFLFDIFVDDKKVREAVPFSASKEWTLSDYISIGELTPGRHTVALSWTNDMVSDTYDTNLGISSIEVFRK